MKVAAIVPAYNEEQTIADVVQTLYRMKGIDEIVVVNDGSEDATLAKAKLHPVTVVDLPENIGKGGALVAGAEATDAEVLLFIDADLVGLNQAHIDALLQPVLLQRAQMSIGVFEEGRLATDWAQKLAPFLSGQRALRRELWEQISQLEDSRYGVEVALSRQADKLGATVETVVLRDLSQVMKEEKRGFLKGLGQRLKMYWEILRSVKF